MKKILIVGHSNADKNDNLDKIIKGIKTNQSDKCYKCLYRETCLKTYDDLGNCPRYVKDIKTGGFYE